MRSIRRRILVLVLGLLGATLTLISFKSYFDAQHEVEEVFDAELAQTARLLAGMVSRGMQSAARAALQASLDEAAWLKESGVEEQAEGGHEYESKLGFLVLDAQARTVLRSASVPVTAFEQLRRSQAFSKPARAPAGPGARSQAGPADALHGVRAGYHDATMDGRLWRLFLLRDGADDLWILVGERADVRGELAEKIALRSLLPDLVGLPLAAALVWLAVGVGLRPLRRMAQMLKSRDPDTLAPLVLTPLPTELEPMAASLNRLLSQVREMLEWEKRFLAYAAHELRTPLAVLRIQAHNAARAPEAADRAEALRQLDRSVMRATRVVEQLLTLARLEPSAAALAMARLDLLALVRGQLAELTPLALERQQELTLEANEQDDYHVVADAHCLSALLQNLVGNAMQHSPDAGQIRVVLEAERDCVELCVQDSGPGVQPELRAKVFERFFRQGAGQGAGLGLSIVARVVELHGAAITLRESPFGGLEASVRFPRSGPQPVVKA